MIHTADIRKPDLDSALLIRHALTLADALDVSTIMVQADAVQDLCGVRRNGGQKIIWLAAGGETLPVEPAAGDHVVRLPAARISRISQIHMGLVLALLDGCVQPDESVLCLAGVVGSGRLDTMVVANPKRDIPWFRGVDHFATRGHAATRALARILEIALRLAAEGREGKPVGTSFAIGSPAEIDEHSHQLILNPCQGHPDAARNIHNPRYLETVRELAAMDGGFAVDHDGTVISAGTYFAAPVGEAELQPGRGARHAAAAALTAATDAVAAVVSESSGSVSVYCDGACVLQIERPAG